MLSIITGSLTNIGKKRVNQTVAISGGLRLSKGVFPWPYIIG